MSLKPSGVFISMSVPRRYVQKWAPWEITPSRNAWPWTRLPMSRPCMSVMATTIVSIWPSRTISSSSIRRGCFAWSWSLTGPSDLGGPVRSGPHAGAWYVGGDRRRRLLGGHPTVRDDHRTGHERRLVRGEEQRHVGDLPRLARPPDRLERIDLGVHLVEPAEHLGMGVVDRRVDPAGGDRVAADALLRVVEGDAFREHDDRALRSRVDRQERLRDEAVDRARVDERAPAAAQHVRDGVAAAVDRASDVHPDRPLHHGVARFVEDAREVDPRVVEDRVEAAPSLDRRVRVRLDRPRVRDIGRDRERLVADPG